jgi:uncharacterized protein (TIGR02452 family)
MLSVLQCLDSEEMAAARRAELDISPEKARLLGRSTLEAIRARRFRHDDGLEIDWRSAIDAAVAAKVSVAPDAILPEGAARRYPATRLQVTNETTLGAARRLVVAGHRPLALNFANGLYPGGGFLRGARAQEEVLCRSSALYTTLEGDEMYAAHARRRTADSTNWAILSPGVPVFRADDGTTLDEPWLLSVITCAAPHAPSIGQPEAGNLLETRIRRILAVARAYDYGALVLGAWGCGAFFRNDPVRTAADFRSALSTEFGGAFEEVVFAIADWSPERKFLGPFRDAFAS